MSQHEVKRYLRTVVQGVLLGAGAWFVFMFPEAAWSVCKAAICIVGIVGIIGIWLASNDFDATLGG